MRKHLSWTRIRTRTKTWTRIRITVLQSPYLTTTMLTRTKTSTRHPLTARHSLLNSKWIEPWTSNNNNRCKAIQRTTPKM